MKDGFLVDECLSPDLVALAHVRGCPATHVLYRGLQGSSDRDLVALAFDEGLAIVTSNGRDFRRLTSEMTFHPGLVVIVPGNITTGRQTELFGRVLDVLEPMTDLINKLVEVFTDGRVEISDWPSG